ncbi:hypothetical protein UCDDS831_g02816 [Diplodia seriata]|uniref:Uncharacterized protein n=1 Tax=Diplodia seriata TaxID=420778 RepID=A0A0G2H4X1_9PEZI|nr:hypothetical protein UCDDS831_g02816 [Diplodia seriata]
MPPSEYQERLKRQCLDIVLDVVPSWAQLGHVRLVCESGSNHWCGPWWEVRCVSGGPSRVVHLVHKGPDGRGCTRLKALRMLREELLSMR